MSLGTNRDYKTTDRRTRENLAKHFKRMQELMVQGMSKEEASKQAYDELFRSKKAGWLDIGPDPEAGELDYENEQMAIREVALSDGIDRVLSRLGRAVKSSKMTRDGVELAGVNGRFIYVDISGRGASATVKWELFENDGVGLGSGNAQYNSDWAGKLERVAQRIFGRMASIKGIMDELASIARELE